MNRNEAISTIEALYPPDTETGEKLLQQAKNDCNSWKNLPDEILLRYADLCQQEETRQTNRILVSTKGEEPYWMRSHRHG
jgi:hypothetical protein